jgi:quercetin dioxygenase-like cupin family protein
MPVSQPVLVPRHQGEVVRFGNGSEAELKVEGSQNGGEYGVVELRVRRGDEPPLHVHTREDESVYLLSGNIIAILGDARIEVPEGSFAVLPRKVPHTFEVVGDAASLLVTLQPAGVERYFVPRAGHGEPDPADFGIEVLSSS